MLHDFVEVYDIHTCETDVVCKNIVDFFESKSLFNDDIKLW